MRRKITAKELAAPFLIIILLYSGARTLATVGNHGESDTFWGIDESGLGLEAVLQNLEEGFSVGADSVYMCDVTRDPLVKGESTAQPQKGPLEGETWHTSEPVKPSPQKPRPRLTCLILDNDPAAIIEVGDRSYVVKEGDLLEGNMVLDIDERGVQLIINGAVVTLQ